MANDLTTTSAAVADPYSPPALPTTLATLVVDERLWRRQHDSELYDNVTSGLPVLAGEERAAAERALAEYEAMPRGSTPDHVRKLVGSLSWMPRQDGGADAAKMQLAVYKTALADIDGDVLALAFREAVQTLTFFPSIAELRAIAARLPTPARYREAWRLRKMLAARDQPHADSDLVDPTAAAAIIDEFGLRREPAASTRRSAASPRAPDAAFYISQGMSQADAERAVRSVAEEMAAAQPEAWRIDRKRAAGWRLVARALAGSYAARRRRADATGYRRTAAEMIAKHGRPPLAWLIGETRIALEMRRDMAA